MSGNNPTTNDLPSYIKNGDYEQQETYHELLNTILRQWFNSSGFFSPTLTNADVAALLALPTQPPPGTEWYNSDIDAKQFIGITGAVQTITSTY